MRGKFFLFIIILGIIFGGIGYYYYKNNMYSKDVLKLEILGPDTAELGEDIEYVVKYKNNGGFVLEEPKLIFEYPQYSVVENDKPQRQEIPLEDIYPGAENALSFKGKLLGKENESKVAKAWLSYRPKNLKARYESATTLTAIIKPVPLTFEFDLPSKVESGKEFHFRLNYFSNANYPLSNLRVFVDYPSDFEFISSMPKSLEKTEWGLGLLNRTDGGRIEIVGKVSGEPAEEKIFKARLGIWQDGEYILLKEAVRGLEIMQPSIFISWQINGSPRYITNVGDYLHYEIFFKNTGEKPLENLFLVAKLDDSLLDFSTIQPGNGKFQESSKTLIWDHTMNQDLRFLDSMDEGKVDFWIKVKDQLSSNNPVIKTKISLSQVNEEIETKVNAKLALSQKGYFSQGPFVNSGSLPPTVGQSTSYTIFWQIQNFYNDVKNVKVKATLPSQVRLSGELFPKDAKFAFDQVSREIVWDVGDLVGESAGSTTGKEIFFQVVLTPDPNQRGQAAQLVSEAKIIGQDSWTEAPLETKAPEITTSLPDDVAVSGKDIVQ